MAEALSMLRKALNLYLSQHERRDKKIVCSIQCSLLLIQCIINIQYHFKVYKLLSSEMLDTFPLYITMLKYL